MPLLLIAFALFCVAALYASVGHGGASGYLAVLALAGAPPEEIRPTSLILNVLVSGVALFRFAGRGHFRWRTFWPFAVTAAPCAFVAGWRWSLDDAVYGIVLALILAFAAWRLAVTAGRPADPVRDAPLMCALPIGAAIGVVSGLIGVGGGIFLSPVLILFAWASAQQAAAVSAAFILVSSLAGLGGLLVQFGTLHADPADLGVYALAAVAGGALGSTLGATRFRPTLLRRVLAIVLIFAAIKVGIGG